MLGRYLIIVLMILIIGISAVPGFAGNTDERYPSLELLEFLGNWETDDGNWVDPTEMDHMISPDQEQNDDEKQ